MIDFVYLTIHLDASKHHPLVIEKNQWVLESTAHGAVMGLCLED